MSLVKTKAGEVLGKLAVCPAVAKKAAQMAKAFWTTQVTSGFNEAVDTWVPRGFRLDWLPTNELFERGYRAVSKNHHWVMTTGVDAHIDRAWGATLVFVLVNDDMYFKQGREKTIHRPGEWFIFNDAASHEVNPTKSSPLEAVYLGWAVQLEQI
ncbi:hypothetical protein [Polaromonas sp.]|uniref:hypothetical protein n=1 Tax=Polaromonas sp. TaxID=1869339 RepID=UPI003BB670B9